MTGFNLPEEGFATYVPAQLPAQHSQKLWLIDQLWLNQGCGIIGGEAKIGKTLLALSMAVALASGKPCLNQFAIDKPKAVLLYSAEHSFKSLRQRIDCIARQCNARLDDLDIHIIAASEEMRLDLDHCRFALFKTIERIKPALVILDPFARIHQINENLTHEVAPILNHLRMVQQRFKTAVAVVHHTKKTTGCRPGQSLRGTSDLHAWGDSNLYLSQNANGQLTVFAEHRDAASRTKVNLALKNNKAGVALHIVR